MNIEQNKNTPVKNSKKRLLIVITAVVLAVALCAGAVIGVVYYINNHVADPVIEYDGQKIPLSFYELMLSRMKGELARNQYEVDDESFWNSDSGVNGQNYEEYYNDAVLENCKTYLAALAVFEELDLKLPQSYYDSIDEEIEFYISYDGNDSKDKFNEILKPYGVDIKSLRQAYVIEAKVDYLRSYLYGADAQLVGDTVKEEYYNDNYYRFKQILIANYYYEYEKDENGNLIYFSTETGNPVYDEENGKPKYDEAGNMIRDEAGNPIYYDEEGNILYDTENGVTSVVKDEDGEGIMHYYPEEELEKRKQQAQDIASKISLGNYAAFESAMEENNDASSGSENFPDGYYLSDIESSLYEEYMIDILDKLKELETGETAVVETEYGYHVIMRYELDEGAYSKSENESWFTNFNSSLITELFLDRCGKYLPQITEIPENLSKSKSIKELGINYYF